jgi:ABC-type transport system involved in cytochrome c biogenesis permease subunit
MRRRVAALAVILGLAYVASTLVPASPGSPFDLEAFAGLPALSGGRIKPMDTVARTGLLMLQGRQRLVSLDGREVPPAEWLLDVFFKPAEADALPVFRIDNPDVLSLFNLGSGDTAGRVRFSYAEIQAGLPELERQSRLAEPVEEAARTAFQRAVVTLRDHVDFYARLKYALGTPDGTDLSAALSAPDGLKAHEAEFEAMDTFGPLLAIPPGPSGADGESREWMSMGRSLRESVLTGSVDPHARLFADLGQDWRSGRAGDFNRGVRAYREELSGRFGKAMGRCAFEAFVNRAEPFYASSVLYVAAFLLAVISWLRWPDELRRAALGLMALAFVLATAGIAARMWIEGRPPVTNLYSSALFIGWGAAGLCLVLERMHRNAVASAAGSLIGFGALVIAHNLSLGGDTLEMMRAVLDSNFWLSTHVVAVTTGYAATFLAGFLAIIYVVRGVLTHSLDRATADSLARMVYGIVCFATFFSFVGTVLGGIWADQSWGRFWGWDPKENGALIIVLWNAVILHCRWGGLVRQRGLMALAIFGNVVTSWSWFGTNMLGVGLHSYGFTEAAFRGLVAFVASQAALIALALIPVEKWKSLRT